MRSLLLKLTFYLRGEKVSKHLEESRTLAGCDADALSQYVNEKLRAVLHNYRKSNPHYVGDINGDAGETSCESTGDSQLHGIPFLTKADCRKLFNEPDKPSSGLDRRSTSGSTGEPLVFYKDHLATGYMEAVQELAFSWHGIKPSEREARFWGMPTGRNRKVALVKDYLKNRIRFSAFDLSESAKETFLNRFLNFNPNYIYGYPSLILEFGRYVKEKYGSGKFLNLKAVIGTGEYITVSERKEIEAIFNARFVSEYGCSEVGVIGFECAFGKMHLMASNITIEIVDENFKHVSVGESGEIVVTELNSGFTPFVRYRIGDKGRFTGESCECGVSWPVFEVLAGRRDDYIIKSDGTKIYDAILAYTLKKGVYQFKAVQPEIGVLKIYLCVDESYNEEMESQYKRELLNAFDGKMEIEFVYVNYIEREGSGKLRYFRSEIKK